MNKHIPALCAAVAIAWTGGQAVARAVTGPDYVGVFEASTPANARTQLERQKAQGTYKLRALGYGGVSGFYEISGDRSPVRFQAGQPVSFVVRVESQQNDPQNLFQISRLETKPGKRILPAVIVGFSSKNKMTAQAVTFNADKHGSAFFKITPSAPLAPGEYLVSAVLPQDAANAGSRDVFLFGVD